MTPLLGTGLTGLVASRFVELFKDDFDFTNLDLTTGIDITNQAAVNPAITQSSASVCVHSAAFTNVDAAFAQTGDKSGPCYQINVTGTQNIAAACAQAGKHLIHISTDFVFDGTKTEGLYTEADPPHPIEWYGLTKLWAEQEVEKSGASYTIARLTYPFRAYYPQRLDLVRSLIEKLTTNTLTTMFTDHILTPTFVDDIAKALKVMIDKKPKGIFHVVGSTPVSDYDLAVKVAQTFALDPSTVKRGSLTEFLKTTNRPYQKRLADSNAKLKTELGVSMRTLDEALLEMNRQLKTT
mgnify:CR=1 FL=1